MATYNIGYIVISSAGMMMGNLVFGLIKDSIVFRRVKAEKKEIEKKRIEMVEILKRKSTVYIPHKNMDTDRDLVTKES